MSDINCGTRGQDPDYWSNGAENLLLSASWRPFGGQHLSLIHTWRDDEFEVLTSSEMVRRKGISGMLR
jgi:hypothetical protein